MTAREFLGDDNIRKLEGLGFSPLAIRDLAKKEYETKKQSLIDRGINEGVAAQGAYENMSDHEIEQMNDDANRGWIRRGWDDTKKAVLETANAYSKFNDYGKDVENYLNKKISGDEKAKFERKTKSSLSEYADKEIKRIDKADERWAQAHPDEWNVAGFAGGLVGGFIDPINLIPLAGSAKWGKKVLYYAGTGAAAGGVSAYGGDRNVGEGVVTGAVGGAFLGPLMEYGVSGISKLIAKRRTSKAANEADAIESAENSDFLRATDEPGGSEIKAANGQDGDAPLGGGVKTAQADDIARTMTAREFATGEAGLDEATAAKVVKEVAQGKEKSDFVDADTYADIVKFKNFENQRDYARAYGEQIEAAKQSLESAREQSAVRYADTQRAINEYQKQGMSASATRELINAKFKPGADEINYTRAYNDGADVDPRLAGQGIFYAIEKDIAAYKYTPEQYFVRLESKGLGDEQATIFTQAYAKKDINIAKDWANGKAAEVYEEQIRKQVSSEIRAKNEAEGEGWTMRDGGEAKTDYVIKTDLSPNARDISKITTDEISADLEYLAGKHPEIFDKPSDVFRLVKDIKENPTHFFTNNRLDYALIVKRLKNNKIGKLAIDKQSGEVKHATKVKDKDLKRLAKVSEEKSGNAGIIQTFTRPGSKLENQGLGYQDETIISQKGNLVNEKEANRLRDSVSSIGDNASRAGGRQAGDKQILRQGRRDTTNASQTKRPAQSDEQVEQQWAAKADGEADAAAAGEQVVEKQASGASIGGGVATNSNAHLGSGLVAGTLNSIDEDGNFSPERFAAGFLMGLAGGKAVATGLRKMTPKLYNKILGVAEKMPQMANGNPRLLGKLYSNGKDVSLNSFAGEKAITANVGKLDQAKAMLEKGADEVEIWQKTGWFKDEIDDKWKFEINPRGGELKPNPPRNTVLYNVLNDEKLYEAYPELQLYKVEVAGEYNPAALKALGSADGGFIPSQKTFIINEKTTDFKSTLYHEIQHAIQEIEGFSPGANSKNGKYWLAGGEVEARNVQKRMNDVSYDGFKNSTSMEFFPYKEEAQLQRMAGDKEYMEYHELSKKFDDYLNDKGDGLSAQEEARLGELYEKIKDRLGFTGDDYQKGYELYLKENAEYQKHPLHTLNAPRSERVNIGRGDLKLSKELEKKYILKDGSINEAAVGKEAEPFIEKEYSLENFKAEFSNGKVDTPIGEVDISSSQFQKLERKGRKKYLGLIKPTLERPVFVVDFEDTTFFFKPFRDKDGVVKFASVIKERDGGLDVISNYPMKNRKFELITREGKVRYVRSSGGLKPIEHSSDGKGIIQQNEEKVHHYRNMEEIKREHPNVEKELDESIAAMNKESFNDVNFKNSLLKTIDDFIAETKGHPASGDLARPRSLATQELGKSVNLSGKQLAVLKNDIKNADFKVINESKIYFDKIGKDGDKKRFFVDIAEDGSLRVDGYSKKDIDSIPAKQSALEELVGVGDAARLKNMSFEVKAAYRNELDPIKKEAILKTAELNKLKKAAQGGDRAAAAKFEEFKAKNLDENGDIKDGLSLC